MASNKSWGYHSRRIANKNFYPINPLQYDNYPETAATNGRSVSSIFSFVLRCVTSGTVKKEDISCLLRRAVLVTELATFF